MHPLVSVPPRSAMGRKSIRFSGRSRERSAMWPSSRFGAAFHGEIAVAILTKGGRCDARTGPRPILAARTRHFSKGASGSGLFAAVEIWDEPLFDPLFIRFCPPTPTRPDRLTAADTVRSKLWRGRAARSSGSIRWLAPETTGGKSGQVPLRSATVPMRHGHYLQALGTTRFTRAPQINPIMAHSMRDGSLRAAERPAMPNQRDP